MQAYTSGEASYDHAEISVRVEDHRIIPVLHVFTDIDVDLDVYLTCLSWDRYSVSGQRCDNICQAQRKVVGASAIGLSAWYAGDRSKHTFDSFVPDGRIRTGDYKVYISVVLLLRGFVRDAHMLEKKRETWQKGGLDRGVDGGREAREGSVRKA